jgi:hypothetical protein
MKIILPILLIAVTGALIAAALVGVGQFGGTVGIAAGSALFTPNADTPDRALTNLLTNVKRRNWDLAYSALSNRSAVDKDLFIRDWTGSNGSLRTLSNLESFDLRPTHATGETAQFRTILRWTTPVGPIEDVHDFQLAHEDNTWKVVWPNAQVPTVPAQVIPVNYLRWDLVTGSAGDEWGSKNMDAPHVRIVSMNAVDSGEGAVVMGEVVNEDTIPAFINVNAVLVDGGGNAMDDETSFDKIAHVLLPKQVSPYRIDFPKISLKNVKNVRMDVKASLVPASADPVIGVMNQKLDADVQGKSVLHGDLLNQSGQTVNIPHVIASFYDNNGKVVWVSDGYVEHSLLPQVPEPFAVEIPRTLAGQVQSYHVVVNQYSLGRS